MQGNYGEIQIYSNTYFHSRFKDYLSKLMFPCLRFTAGYNFHYGIIKGDLVGFMR